MRIGAYHDSSHSSDSVMHVDRLVRRGTLCPPKHSSYSVGGVAQSGCITMPARVLGLVLERDNAQSHHLLQEPEGSLPTAGLQGEGRQKSMGTH